MEEYKRDAVNLIYDIEKEINIYKNNKYTNEIGIIVFFQSRSVAFLNCKSVIETLKSLPETKEGSKKIKHWENIYNFILELGWVTEYQNILSEVLLTNR